MTAAVAAEWHKLRSVRSTLHVLGTVVAFLLLCVLWSLYVRGYWDGLSLERRAEIKTAAPEQPLLLALPVCGTVLGALTITSEYATGMIRASLAAVPSRGTLFAAKATVVGLVALAVTAVSVALASVSGQAIVGDRAVPVFEVPWADQVPHLAAFSVVTAGMALMALGLGAVLRSSAGAITTLLVAAFVLPAVTNVVPDPWGERLWSVLPANLAEQIASPPASQADIGVLSPATACVLLAAYVVVSLGAGAFSFLRRDA